MIHVFQQGVSSFFVNLSQSTVNILALPTDLRGNKGRLERGIAFRYFIVIQFPNCARGMLRKALYASSEHLHMLNCLQADRIVLPLSSSGSDPEERMDCFFYTAPALGLHQHQWEN